MAYTPVITKQGVSQISGDIFSCVIEMVVSDEGTEVFRCTATEKYNRNNADFDGIKSRLINELKSKWDKYAAENTIFSAAQFDTMVSEIQTAASNYINA